LEILFSEARQVSYNELISKLQSSYFSIGHPLGNNKVKKLKVFLENKRMLLKEGKHYRFNPDYFY